jgi:phosphoribosylformimino-5-aminoimidazole carboxamide ribotide isomerase
MIVQAAIDLSGGRVVQLVGGRPDAQRVSLPDPSAVARRWVTEGFGALHVIDLDAALGTGDNRTAIAGIIADVSVPVQAGGGLRDDAAIDAVLSAGAARAIAGTRAVEDRTWLEALCARLPGRIVVAADVRAGRIVTRGWTAGGHLDGVDFLRGLDGLDLAGVLVTDVSREGRMSGIDANRFRALVAATRHPLIAAGGIGDIVDLRILEEVGAAGAVLGMSLYTGAITADAVAREFAA